MDPYSLLNWTTFTQNVTANLTNTTATIQGTLYIGTLETAMYTGIFLFAVWLIFALLAEWKDDLVYGIMTIALSAFVWQDVFLNSIVFSFGAGTTSLAFVLFVAGWYVLMMTIMKFLKRSGVNF